MTPRSEALFKAGQRGESEHIFWRRNVDIHPITVERVAQSEAQLA